MTQRNTMGLEQDYHLIDIKPKCFPFKIQTEAFPSTAWESVQRKDFAASDFIPGPKAVLPDIVRVDNFRSHRPNGGHAYHIRRIGNPSVCNIDSPGAAHAGLFAEDSRRYLMTEMRHCYTPKKRHPEDKGTMFFKASDHKMKGAQAIGIVPGTELVPLSDENLIPSSRKDKLSNMSSVQMSEFDNQKRAGLKPYKDNTIILHAPPPLSDPHSHNMSSLVGQQFSRRRQVNTRSDALPVDKFDGGPKELPYTPHLRCGYRIGLESSQR